MINLTILTAWFHIISYCSYQIILLIFSVFKWHLNCYQIFVSYVSSYKICIPSRFRGDAEFERFSTFPLISWAFFVLRFSKFPPRRTRLISLSMQSMNKIESLKIDIFKTKWFLRGRYISPMGHAIWVNVQHTILFTYFDFRL